VLQHGFKILESVDIYFGRVVGMDSGAGVDERMRIGETDGRFEIGRAVAGSDRENILDANLAGTFDDSLAVTIELRIIKMAVGIDELQS